MRLKYLKIVEFLTKGKDLPLLIMRFFIAYRMYEPAIKKMNNMEGTIHYFEGLGIPMPTINAYMAMVTENLGVWLLILGLGVRIISIPLMVTMLVAILTVHYANGFSAASNGFEIPLYLMIMLFTLLIYGGGKLSIDNFFNKK